MKRTILAVAAAIMMSAGALAQDNKNEQRKPMDKAEMAKQRTGQMVKAYELDEEQAGKLLVLNTEYADKLPPMMGPRGGQRGQRPQADRQRPQERPDSARQGGQRPPRGQRPQMNREEMQKTMEAYNAELKQIMNEEQYKKYETDMQKRMKEGPRGPRGERPQRNNSNNN